MKHIAISVELVFALPRLFRFGRLLLSFALSLCPAGTDLHGTLPSLVLFISLWLKMIGVRLVCHTCVRPASTFDLRGNPGRVCSIACSSTPAQRPLGFPFLTCAVSLCQVRNVKKRFTLTLLMKSSLDFAYIPSRLKLIHTLCSLRCCVGESSPLRQGDRQRQ